MAMYQIGNDSLHNAAHLDLLEQLLSQPLFETLRTQLQLGYVVYSMADNTNGVVALGIVVQGKRQ